MIKDDVKVMNPAKSDEGKQWISFLWKNTVSELTLCPDGNNQQLLPMSPIVSKAPGENTKCTQYLVIELQN